MQDSVTPRCAAPGAKTDVLIFGGGLAGAAAGAWLAQLGCEVEIVEQSSAMQHKVCGEFVSAEAVGYLAQLGLNLGELGAVPIHSVRLVAHTPIAECELPFPAMSITRRKLDEALLSLAQSKGAIVRRGCRVESLRRCTNGWIAQLRGGEIRRAQTVFLATGKHDLGGYRRPPGRQNDLIAFKMYFQLEPHQQQALRGWVELALFPGGYAGLQLVEDGAANLCLLVNRATLQRCRNNWQLVLKHIFEFSAHLSHRLQNAQPLLSRPLALSAIPYGMIQSRAEPGLWRLGDQAAVTPSFSGDGMSIALHSARLAAELFTHGGSSTQLAERLHRELLVPIRLATTLSHLMVAAPALAHLLRVYPRVMGVLASTTRIPEGALAR